MNQRIRNYRGLKVWQRGIDLVKKVYSVTREFPKHEQYALANQMQRSAVSVPSNIAEGQTRKSSKEFKQFLYIAQSSLSELDTQIVISQELGYLDNQKGSEIESVILELRRMIYALINSLPKN